LLVATCAATLLAVPIGVLATFSLLSNTGGPVSVLALLIAVRDFKLVYSLLRTSWLAPHLLQARAQGMSAQRTALVHLFPVLRREILALALMSLVVALSSIVPVEVIFDAPGLGQLAWSAAMNRDLPVLTAVTALLAGCVGIAGVFAGSEKPTEVAQCV
jgi:peptide/nickel transport system permease protein